MFTVAANFSIISEKAQQDTNKTMISMVHAAKATSCCCSVIVGGQQCVGCAAQQKQKQRSMRSAYVFYE